MKHTIFIIILTVSFFTAKSQSLNKKFIDNILENTFNDVKIFENSLYMIDGMGFKSDKVDVSLNKFKENELVGIDYLSHKTISKAYIYDKETSFIAIITKNRINRKYKKNELKRAKEKYIKRELIITSDIDTTLREPVLIINGKQIYHYECYNVINTIRIKDIETIFSIRHPVLVKSFGLNAVNGLIEIKTKRK